MPRRSRLPPLSPTKDLADYVLSGRISRWLWRIYTQRLTSAGRWFSLITMFFVAYGGASLQLQGYVVAAYAGAIWIVAIAAMLLYRPRVAIVVRHSPRVSVGEEIQVDVELTQKGRLRGADLWVLPHRLPPDIDSVPDQGISVRDLKYREQTLVRLGLVCHRRGAFILRGFRVETGFPFGILRARRTFASESRVLVYPTFRPLGSLYLPAGRRYQPGGVVMSSQLGDSFEYLGNREFREGDNLRDIDWRATARSSKLIVREWVEEYMLRAAVVLDTHVPRKLGTRIARERREAMERAISIAASVSDYMARQDYLVDVLAAGPNLYHLTAGRSLAYLDQILDILACVEESAEEPFQVVEPQMSELLEKLSTAVCVLLDWDPQRRSFVQGLREHGIAVKAIIVRDSPCTLEDELFAENSDGLVELSSRQWQQGIDEL